MDTIFLDEFSREVWETTYKHGTDNSIDDSLKRVATALASVEKTEELRTDWAGKFYELLTDFKVTAGGRILANAGTSWKGVTLMNCFVGPKPKYDQDSIEGIMSVLLSQALTLKSEGGWGMNFSFIRPRGSFIHGIGVESPGAIKYQELFNTSSDVITSGAGKKKAKKTIEGKTKIRKGAMMSVLDVWHPDIEEHITAKLQEGRLNKFNLSVNCSNEFMDRVAEIAYCKGEIAEQNARGHGPTSNLIERLEKAEKWELIFPDTKYPAYKAQWDGNMAEWKHKGYPVIVHKTISVSELWELIMQSTYNRNDPGVLFLDRANETHCYYYGPGTHIAATNPCGEQCLPFGYVCNLGSLNLTQFVTKNAKFDWSKLERYVPWLARMLDNVNDLTSAPLPEYAESIKNVRRIGMGIMGWGSLLYMLKIRFGSPEAEQLKNKIMKRFTSLGINASIDLAIEKGMFIGCEPKKHAQAKYFKQIDLDDETLERIRKHGIRNSALFSCQPTGNTGVLANVVSGGIEPIFMAEYVRTVIVDGCPQDMLEFTPKYWEGEHKETDVFKWTQEGSDKILRGVYNGIVYKIDKNRGLTKEVACIDYGVRWLRERGEWDEKADWAVTSSTLSVDEHLTDMNGFARWIDSSISKTVNIPNEYPYQDFKTLYLNAYLGGVLKGITTYRAGTMMNVLAAAGSVAKTDSDTLPSTFAPKRPKELNGELHHFVIEGKKYYVAVGLFGKDEQPYEVFTGVNESRKETFIPKSSKTGKIIKHKRGEYTYVDGDGEQYELTNGHSNDTADALTRIISTSLRHGTDISFIVHQLEKTKGPIICFSKALARTLKKYIKDGTAIAGEECPVCSSVMTRKEGCAVCPQCGHSKCA